MAENLSKVEADMCRLNIDILGLNEVRWPVAGKQKTSKGFLYYAEGTDPNHRYGTADEIAKSVTDFIPLNDRVMVMKIQTSYRTMVMITIYDPKYD